MDNIKVNPNTSTANINHLYPISTSLSQTLVNLNYGNDTINDLRRLFYVGKVGDDSRLDSVGNSVYHYNNYEENNVDKIPTTVSYEELRKMVNQMIDSQEYIRKRNLIDYFNNVVFGDFVLGYYSAQTTKIENKSIQEISNRDTQIVKSYIPGYYKFLHVKNAPNDLCAYVNIRGILFKMNKVADTNNSTEFDFQYPAFLLEQYTDLPKSVLNISFNMVKSDLGNIEIYGAKESVPPENPLTPISFNGLNYFKKFE